jgi:cell division protein ZapA (FtsZ GTPase activity inhibitor)
MAKLKIQLLGENFTIQANEDEQYLQKLLGYYQRITNDIQSQNQIKDNLQIAILSGIMLCDELYKEKQNKVAHENGQTTEITITEEEELEKRTKYMIDKINEVL